jgi:hypothetical protein
MNARARILRINKVLHSILKKYPEQTIVMGTIGAVTLSCALYTLFTKTILTIRPYYRGRYDIVRPDHPLVHGWRPPTDYPPPYMSGRHANKWNTVAHDYGWNTNFD